MERRFGGELRTIRMHGQLAGLFWSIRVEVVSREWKFVLPRDPKWVVSLQFQKLSVRVLEESLKSQKTPGIFIFIELSLPAPMNSAGHD